MSKPREQPGEPAQPEIKAPKNRGTRPSYLPETPPAKITIAIKALAVGTATSVQQREALAWIVNDLCGTQDWAYKPGPDGARETDICLGRQLVGKRIVEEVNIPGTLLQTRSKENG